MSIYSLQFFFLQYFNALFLKSFKNQEGLGSLWINLKTPNFCQVNQLIDQRFMCRLSCRSQLDTRRAEGLLRNGLNYLVLFVSKSYIAMTTTIIPCFRHQIYVIFSPYQQSYLCYFAPTNSGPNYEPKQFYNSRLY